MTIGADSIIRSLEEELSEAVEELEVVVVVGALPQLGLLTTAVSQRGSAAGASTAGLWRGTRSGTDRCLSS